MLDASHSQINRFSGSVEILLPVRFAGVAQVATPSLFRVLLETLATLFSIKCQPQRCYLQKTPKSQDSITCEMFLQDSIENSEVTHNHRAASNSVVCPVPPQTSGIAILYNV